VFDLVGPDCVHILGPAILGHRALTFAKESGIAVIGTNHLMPANLQQIPNLKVFPRWTNQRIWMYLARFYSRCDFVTAPTNTALKYLVDAGLSAPCSVISNGVKVDRPAVLSQVASNIVERYGLNRTPGTLRLLYVGRVNREKAVDILIRGFQRIHSEIRSELVIAGIGNDTTRLRRLIRTLGLDESVRMIGYVSDSDKQSLMKAANLFVMPSPAELQSIATLEAMSAGLPILVADAGALAELCPDNSTGRTFVAGDPESLARSALSLIRSREESGAIGRANRRFVGQSHAWESTLDRYETIYEKAIDRKSL
jgi:glycosyltransferase involved in cell wall biosynthesis